MMNSALWPPHDITSNVEEWVNRGYEYQVIETALVFDSIKEARELLTFYFGEKGSKVNKTEIEYKVVAYNQKVK